MSSNGSGATAIAPSNTSLQRADEWNGERVEFIRKQFCGGAPDAIAGAFIEISKRRGLAPEERHIYLVKRGSNWVIQTGIDGYRSMAARSGEYAGSDDAVFDTERDEHPGKATVTVWRLVNGQRCSFTASARWSEYYSSQGGMWDRMPFNMLAKCSEALALRKAFPAELAGVYTDAEMDQAEIAPAPATRPPERPQAPPRPATPQQPTHATAPQERVQDGEYHEVTSSRGGIAMTWVDCFAVLRKAHGLASKNAVAKHLGRDSIEGLSPQDVYDLVMGTVAPAPAPSSEPATDPVNAPRKPPPGIQMTEKQWWKMWASANEKMPRQADEGLHAIALESFGRDSLKDLTVDEASKVIDFLEKGAAEEIMLYVGPLMRQKAVERGQQEMPMAGAVDISPDEAALIGFRERAESGEGWPALLEEAGASEEHLIVLAETATTVGQSNQVRQRAKERGRYTVRFTVAEQKVRPGLEARAVALSR